MTAFSVSYNDINLHYSAIKLHKLYSNGPLIQSLVVKVSHVKLFAFVVMCNNVRYTAPVLTYYSNRILSKKGQTNWFRQSMMPLFT